MTTGSKGERKRIAIAEGVSREHLEEITSVFQSNGIDFEIEDQAGPDGGWRLLVAPGDALRARIALAVALRRLRKGQKGEGQATDLTGPDPSVHPGPLFEGGEGYWLRVLVPLALLGLALWLTVRGLVG